MVASSTSPSGKDSQEGYPVEDSPERDLVEVRLKERLDSRSLPRVQEAFGKALETERGIVAVHMDQATFLVSMVIRELILLSNRMRSRRGRFLVVGLKDAPLASLEATGMLSMMEAVPDLENALRASGET